MSLDLTDLDSGLSGVRAKRASRKTVAYSSGRVGKADEGEICADYRRLA